MAEDTPTNSVPAAGTANPAGERAPSAEPKDAPAPTETPSGEETEKSNGSEEKETREYRYSLVSFFFLKKKKHIRSRVCPVSSRSLTARCRIASRERS